MQDQQIMADTQATTPVAPAADTADNTQVVNNSVQGAGVQPEERRYTKGEVIELMKKRIAQSHNSFFTRYGVKDLDELDNVFNEGKSIKDEFAKLQLANSDLARTNAFLKNNINPDKYDDIKAYFKGNDLEFNEDALLQAISTHPEWLKPSTVPQQTTIKTLGSEAHVNPPMDETEAASKLLGVRL